MLLLGITVFIAVFVVVALLIAATGVGATEREKQALSRLNSVLAAETSVPQDDLIDIRKQEVMSEIPLLNRLLMQLEVAPKLRQLLYQADVHWSPGGLLVLSLGSFLLATYIIDLRTRVLLVSALAGLIPAVIPFVYVFYKRSIRFNKFEEDLPAALDLMVSGLRSGHSLISSINLVAQELRAPIGPEFRICADEQNYGLELRTAMSNLAARVPIQDIRIMVTAILIQKETGGNLAEVLEKSSYVIRERFRLNREIRTKTAQGRLTGWILTFLPPVLGLLLFLANPAGISLLWTNPLGQKMLYASIAMTAIGGLIIRQIIRIRI